MTKAIRCAVYTRKSSEEGLEQSFNSLDAQREACEAYIASQSHEGWKVIKTQYDDGGLSGATMERPGLQSLLLDVQKGRIDVIVVYKVDRLTRALVDFAKIIELLDDNNASFVSITQHFNTTTSMGRLTLNVLLSFAQYERELTGERIRDKFAASRKKGMWMGGTPPLGYDIGDRVLVINEDEAERVRYIYQRYVELGSVRNLAGDLKRQNIRSKRWTTNAGVEKGGNIFKRGALYTLLQNRVYIGEVVHKGEIFPGEHDAIVLFGLWEKVQNKLSKNRHSRNTTNNICAMSPLNGLLHDDRGNRMSSSHTLKPNGKRYRYYVSQALLKESPEDAGTLPRLPAPALEKIIFEVVRNIIPDQEETRWNNSDLQNRTKVLNSVIRHITMGENEIRATLYKKACDQKKIRSQVRKGAIKICSDSNDEINISFPTRLYKWGGEKIIETPTSNSFTSKSHPNKALIKAITKALDWREALASGRVRTFAEIARNNGCLEGYVRHILKLGFLAPDIVEAILDGKQPRKLTLKSLFESSLPQSWPEQRKQLGFS